MSSRSAFSNRIGNTARALLAATQVIAVASAFAQPASYPNKPIQLIAQQPPGSQSEAISRIWAECVAKDLGQPVVVINKPGANGVIATSFLKGQPADGYHVMTVGMSQMTITPYVYKNLPYNPYTDFDGVAVLSVSPLILVASTQSGIKKLSDIPAVAKSMAGGVNYGSPGKGSPAHLFSADVTESLAGRSDACSVRWRSRRRDLVARRPNTADDPYVGHGRAAHQRQQGCPARHLCRRTRPSLREGTDDC